MTDLQRPIAVSAIDPFPQPVAVGPFPNDDVIVRLVRAMLLEQNDEWAVPRSRYTTLETIGQISDDPIISLPAVAR